MQKHVLVTGGAGYIGSQCCKSLRKSGFIPVCLDDLSVGYKDSVKWGPFIKGDIGDIFLLKDIFAAYRPEAIMHFAANALVNESVKDPAKYYDNNVVKSFNLFNTMRLCGVKKIIFSSTCATYGNPIKIPIDENHIQCPINPYGNTKLMMETMLKDFKKAYGMQFVILRYFNACGADMENETGEAHRVETHLIPLMIRTALQSEDHLNVYGADFDTQDGSAVRDYIHVEDLCDAHIKALEFLLNDDTCSTELNLGTGAGFSVMQIINTFENLFNLKLSIKITDRREGDPPVLIANADMAKKILNWEPKYSGIENILKTAWKWHNSDLYKHLISTCH
jgi:UDP-glucose 4-epimerase